MIHRILSPPVFADDEQTRVARLLHHILIILAALNILDMLLLVIFAPETLPTFWINWVFLLFIAVSFGLMLKGWVREGGFVICLSLWVLLVLDLIMSGGIASPAFAILYLVIIFATTLLGMLGTVIFGSLSVIATLVFYVAENNHLLPPGDTLNTMRLFPTYLVILLGITTMLTIDARSIQKALRRARIGERGLAQTNQQLRDEITRREHIQREQAKLTAILESTSDFVGIIDPQGRTLYLNPAGRRLMGFSEDENIVGVPVAAYHPAGVVEMILKDALPSAIEGGRWSGENTLLTRSRKEIPISQIIMTHRGTDGRVEYMSTVIRDLSGHLEAEQNRLELALQQERVEVFKEFIGNISHDLRTPLTIINTSLYLLERTDDPQRRREKMENIRQQTTRLDRLIQDLLTLSRLDQAPELTLTPVELNRLLREIQNHIRPTAESKQLTLQFDLGVTVPSILADEQELYRALANLVENAVNYTPEGGSVTVRTDSENGQVITEVWDTGIGIPSAELPHIFERFYRADGARKIRSEGTGLGLAIVKRVIDMHHGTINVESQPGTGTRFSITLPIAANSENASVN